MDAGSASTAVKVRQGFWTILPDNLIGGVCNTSISVRRGQSQERELGGVRDRNGRFVGGWLLRWSGACSFTWAVDWFQGLHEMQSVCFASLFSASMWTVPQVLIDNLHNAAFVWISLLQQCCILPA